MVSRFHEILIWKFWTWKVKTKWRWSFDAIFHFVFQLRNLLIEFTIFKSLGLLSPSYVRISITSKTRKIQKSRKEKKVLSIQEPYSSFIGWLENSNFVKKMWFWTILRVTGASWHFLTPFDLGADISRVDIEFLTYYKGCHKGYFWTFSQKNDFGPKLLVLKLLVLRCWNEYQSLTAWITLIMMIIHC